MYLLDTHAILWYMNKDGKMPLRVRKLIDTTNESVYISIGSFWELAIKESLQKLSLPASISELMADCERCRFLILPIEAGHLARLKTLPRIHGDPFDRLLVCQAQAMGLTILTADAIIPRYNVITWWD